MSNGYEQDSKLSVWLMSIFGAVLSKRMSNRLHVMNFSVLFILWFVTANPGGMN